MRQHLTAALLVLACLSAHAEGWKYETKKDPMTDQVSAVATLKSPTKVKLAPPYGATGGELVVDADGGHVNRIRLIVNRGQLLSSEGLVLRLDDGEPLQLRTVSAADGSSRFLSVVGFSNDDLPALAARIAAASRLRVQATFYGDGEHVFEFQPAGLKVD